MQQHKIPLSYILAVLYIGVAFIQKSPQGAAFSNAIFLHRDLVLRGEIWRIGTYVFMHEGGMIALFFKALIAVFICNPLEMLWGRRFLLIVFWGSTILGGLTATLLGIPLTSGSFVSLSFFLIHGFTFPLSQIYVFFIIPVKIKHLALFSTALYLLNFAQMGIATGIGAMVGLLSGVGLWRFGLAQGWDRPNARFAPKLPKKQSKEVKAQATLLTDAHEIVTCVHETHEVSSESATWIAELDSESTFDEALCAPFSFNPKEPRCSTCGGFATCLKRDTLIKIEDILHPSEE